MQVLPALTVNYEAAFGLATQLPRQVWIAMPQGSHTPKMGYPPVKIVQFSGEAYA